MVGFVEHDEGDVHGAEGSDRLDRLFDDWRRLLPVRLRTMLAPDPMAGDFIRIDEFREDGTLTVRAELPGIDPDRDVDLSVDHGILHIRAERREERKSDERGYLRREIRYGSFARDLPLPEGVTTSAVTATYRNGILEIQVPAPEQAPTTRIPVDTT